jgi:NAD(P)-dependent dehydrogenase (short-subunit alcohol dehydrogenase family)
MHWKDVMYRRGYNPLLAYKQSKLANVLFSVEFNRRESKRSSVLACAIDPGLVNTEIGLKGTSGIVRWIWDLRRKGGTSPEKGAGTIIHLASVDQTALSGNVYWKDSRPCAPSKYSLKQDEATRLWDLSAQLCGL